MKHDSRHGHSSRRDAARPRRRRTILERATSGVNHVRAYASRGRGADKWAIAAWLLVDYAWCQEEEIGVVAAVLVFVSVIYKLSIGTHSPHELTHCLAVMLWASGNVSWMWMEFGQARVRATSHFRGPGAEREDWMAFKLLSLALFFMALCVEILYFTYLRHTPMFEEAWGKNPLTAALVAKHTRRMSASGSVGGSSVFSGNSWGGSESGSHSSAAPSDLSSQPGRGIGGAGHREAGYRDNKEAGYGAVSQTTDVENGNKENSQKVDDENVGAMEMIGVLPRMPHYFKTWDDYESVAIMVWIVKDFSWIFYTKFCVREDDHWAIASKISWAFFSAILLLLHFDFLTAAVHETNENVEWVNYLCLLLWAVSQTLWAAGEIYFHESVTLREPTFEAPENFSDLRWYAGWFAVAGVTILYGYWSTLLIIEVSGWCGEEQDERSQSNARGKLSLHGRVDMSEGDEGDEIEKLLNVGVAQSPRRASPRASA